jgi:fatty-acyl-CoA synthase
LGCDVDAFDVAEFDGFLEQRPDLGTKWVPSFLRVTGELPKLASLKLDKTRLRGEAWCAPAVWWRPTRGERLRLMTPDDVAARAHLLR